MLFRQCNPDRTTSSLKLHPRCLLASAHRLSQKRKQKSVLTWLRKTIRCTGYAPLRRINEVSKDTLWPRLCKRLRQIRRDDPGLCPADRAWWVVQGDLPWDHRTFLQSFREHLLVLCLRDDLSNRCGRRKVHRVHSGCHSLGHGRQDPDRWDHIQLWYYAAASW